MDQSEKVEMVDAADRLAYALAQMSDFQELIRFFDTKAGAAVTIASALLTVVLASYGSVIDLLQNWQHPCQLWLAGITLAFTALFFVAFIRMIYFAFLTLLPRFGLGEHAHEGIVVRVQKGLCRLVEGPTFQLAARSDRTVAFFGHVYAMGKESKGSDFVQEVSAMPLAELVQNTLRQNYLLSEILVQKAAAQGLCFRWLRLVVVFWAVAELGVMLSG